MSFELSKKASNHKVHPVLLLFMVPVTGLALLGWHVGLTYFISQQQDLQDAEPIATTEKIPKITNETLRQTRRILTGHEVGDTKPYMVYLRPAASVEPKILESGWLCGGVIIHERYILTSAACIEDAKHFYVVSGTHKWIPPEEKNNECITNGAKKAVWKCVPKSYYYDGDDFDNIRWMAGDIAVVKVEDDFNFERRVRGCDFIPKKVDFNNRTADLEKSGTAGSIAGWGSTEFFGDANPSPTQSRSTINSPELIETNVQMISKANCKRRWQARYHFIIDEHMICTRDGTDTDAPSVCSEREVNCKELEYSDSGTKEDDYVEKQPERRMVLDPNYLAVHTAAHYDNTRRNKISIGGFCENDHGGPLIVGQGKTSIVVGVMSACLTKDIIRKCHGPFLYTSVYRYRNLITCAIDKSLGATCRKLLRSSRTPMVETTFDWKGYLNGPMKMKSGLPVTAVPQITPLKSTHKISFRGRTTPKNLTTHKK